MALQRCSSNAFFLAHLWAALLKMKQDSQRRLSGIPRSVQPSAGCPSNSLSSPTAEQCVQFWGDFLGDFAALDKMFQTCDEDTGRHRKRKKLLVICLLPWRLFYIINCWCLIKANVGKLGAHQDEAPAVKVSFEISLICYCPEHDRYHRVM